MGPETFAFFEIAKTPDEEVHAGSRKNAQEIEAACCWQGTAQINLLDECMLNTHSSISHRRSMC